MTAEVFSIDQRKATNWSTEKKKGGSAAVTAADFAGVTTVNDALDVCSDAWKTEHTVAPNRIGKATSVLN